MVKMLRDKRTGRFVGSVGAGKVHVPTAGRHRTGSVTNRASLTDEERVLAVLADPRVASPRVEERVAAAEEHPIEFRVAAFLLDDPETRVLSRLAQNSTVNQSLFLLLAGHPNHIVRNAVASNPDMSGVVLSLLAYDSVEIVRRSVANNRNTPGDVLERLVADDNDFIVRRSAQTWLGLSL